ncbi:MAG: glycosyltransferase family 39 protein [Candidatus Latescibacterota bacterium]|nr:MAG: glycosyltransferase family 39 protein [Candidatus Latescibacterota bacterium]
MQVDAHASVLSRHRDLVLVVVAAAALFSANMHHLSLPPLDDCFYARKGVEMAERGASFTVTWNQHPNHQNPPLQFWILGASFTLFGENDFAARLPSLLMALGILVITYRIGRHVLEREAAAAALGLLCLAPLFVQNARRCMLEVPNSFWIALCFLVALESRRHTRLGVLVAVPLAAAGLTKSVLGLLPIPVLAAFALHREGRRLLANPWLLAGLFLGIAGTATWPLHQGLTAGWGAVRSHYVGEIGGRALEPFSIWEALTEYPKVLLREFQPLAIPGVIGALVALRCGWQRANGGRALLGMWVVLPLVLYSFASTRSARYAFPIFVPLALLSAGLLVSWRPRATRIATTRVVPLLLLTLALLFWFSPKTLSRDQNAAFKRAGRDIERLFPADTEVPLLGSFTWRLANPLLYYGHRGVVPLGDAVESVLEMARELPTPAFIASRANLERVRSQGIEVEVLSELGPWLLLRLEDRQIREAQRRSAVRRSYSLPIATPRTIHISTSTMFTTAKPWVESRSQFSPR